MKAAAEYDRGWLDGMAERASLLEAERAAFVAAAMERSGEVERERRRARWWIVVAAVFRLIDVELVVVWILRGMRW